MRVAVYNHKGGVGKSTITTHIGFRAMERNINLVVGDLDRQCNTLKWLSNHQWTGEPYYRGSVLVTPDLQTVKDNENYILDCPPAYNFIEELSGKVDVDVWLVPVTGRFSTDGTIDVMKHVQNNTNGRIVVVINCAMDTQMGKEERKQVSGLDVEIFTLAIPQQDIVRKSELLGVPTWDVPYGSRSMTTQNLRLLSDWVLDGCTSRGVYLLGDERRIMDNIRRTYL